MKLSVIMKRPAMLLLAGCFGASALLRVTEHGEAFAVEIPKLAAAATAPKQGAGAAPALSEAEMGGLLQALREREAQLEAQARALTEKARVIEAAEAKLRDQMARLEEAEARLSSLLRVADNAADKDIEKLVSTFQSMDSKKAGPIFENMDVSFAAGLISRMGETSSAEILSALSPEKAYAIAVYVASQNAQAPTE